MKEKNLRKILEKCSKAELIEAAVELSKCQTSAFHSLAEIVMTKRLDAIDKKLDANLAQLKILNKKLRSIPESERHINNGNVRELMTAINNNMIEYSKLSNQRDKLEKELYG